MSGYEQHPDATKLVDDNCDSDSGFISSGNLMVSGEVSDDKMRISQCLVDSGGDSGCILSDSLSRCSLKGTNDLSKPSIATPVESYAKTKEQPPRIDDLLDYYFKQDEDGDTHLHAAIAEGFAEVALALIRAAPRPTVLDTPNDDARTPLHLAVETAQWRVARWLVVAGAKPSPRDARGDSPLHVAARAGDLRCVQAITDPVQQGERDALAPGYKPQLYQPPALDQWNYVGQTCVHVAALHGHVNVLRHLVWYGADINAREGLQGYTALHYAVEQGDQRLLDFLLGECRKLDVTATTYGGRSALQLRLPTPTGMRQALRNRGVASPSPSEEESEEEDDSEEELPYANPHSKFVPNLVNASA